jgi:hypothetical protein
MQHHVAWWILTDVSEELTASIIRVMKAISYSETSVNSYQITRCCIPEDSHFYLLIFKILLYFSHHYHVYSIIHKQTEFFMGKPLGQRPLGKNKITWEGNINKDLREAVCEGGRWVKWIRIVVGEFTS